MKRPSFQFYPADWQRDANLRRCSHAARGAWMDVLCLLHDSDEYGVLRWPLADIANAASAPMKLLKELADKGVLKGADTGSAAYTFAPSHAGKTGDPVELVATSEGPCWYSGRFLKDEHVRLRRGVGTRFTADNQPGYPSPTRPVGVRQGYGASSASASASALALDSSTHTPPPAPGVGDRGGSFEGHDGIPDSTPNPAARFAIALNQAGHRCTPLNPDAIAYAAEGGTVEHLLACAGLPDCEGKPATYVLRTARRELGSVAKPITGGSNHEPAHQRGGRSETLPERQARRMREHAAAGHFDEPQDAGEGLGAGNRLLGPQVDVGNG